MNRLEYIIKNRKKKILYNFFSSLGLVWTFIELLSYLNKPFKNFTEGNIYILFLVIFISIVFSILASLPKRTIRQSFRNLNTTVNIEIGDLLDKKGNIIIASSNYFDTKTSKTDSLKTQVIKRFFNNAVNHLDDLIQNSIDRQEIKGEKVNIETKPNGKTIKYEIGTTVDIELSSDPDKMIFISVICEVIYNGLTKSKISDFRLLFKALEKTWRHIKNTDNSKDIFIPVLGAGVTGLSLSKSTLIQLIIFSFLLNSKETKIGRSLNIIIPEKNYEPELFDEIQDFLKALQI